jgi:Uncharacterised nucleotidyltransferase
METPPETESAGTRLGVLRQFAARVGPPHDRLAPQLDTTAAEVVTAFEEAGVDVLLLKGAALAALLYLPGEHRGYSDIDLLVAPRGRDAAEQQLTALGFVNTDAIHGVDDVAGVVHAHSWLRTGPDSVELPMVDLHWRFPGSTAEPSSVWDALTAHRIVLEVAGRPVGVLDRSGQAMHLATHAAQHGLAFDKHLNELTLAVERWAPEVWDAGAALAEEIGASEPFAAGLRLVPDGAALASRLSLRTTELADWEIRNRNSRPRGTFHLRALGDDQSWSSRVDIVRRSVLPRRDWITYEYPWARSGRVQLAAAYGLHLLRAPAWAIRAWLFNRRARGLGRAHQAPDISVSDDRG